MMKLSEILNKISSIQVIAKNYDAVVNNITSDSRNVNLGSIFVAVSGFKYDGHTFLLDVINKGVAAVIIEKNVLPDEIFFQSNVTKVLVQDSRIALAEIANEFYGNPSKLMKIFGITGTKGKSTTAIFLYEIIKHIEEKAGLIGTIENRIGDKKIPSKLTTPEALQINEYLAEMLNSGIKSAAIEISSHSLELKRVFGLDIKVAGFTNLASDHLDYHKTTENYLKAKKILFDSLSENSISIINADDESSFELVKNCNSKILTYGTEKSDFQILNIKTSLTGTSFSIQTKENLYNLTTKLIGEFNAFNATLAFAMATSIGFNVQKTIEAIKNAPQIPGRFEVIHKNGKIAIIDYAHTAGSMEAALVSLRKIVGNEVKIFTVFGAGGDRDKTKRPEMGKVAEKYSDKVFVTSDNPRTENPNLIIEDILAGMENVHFHNSDREIAIKTAIEEADGKTVVIIEGKGHETYSEVNGIRTHFDDKEIAEKYL